MGRYGVPRPVRYVFGCLVGASVFAATSVAMFSLAASAGSSTDLLSPLSDTLNSVTSGVTTTVNNTTNTLTSPSGVICQLLCSVTNSSPPASQQNLSSTLQCLSGTSCSVTDPNPSGGSTNNSTSTDGNTTVPPAPASSAPVVQAPAVPPPLTAPPGVTHPGSLVPPPPSSINLPTATSGINFGKAPFLWPLFLGLDVLGAGAVVLALRKTWSRPVAD